MSDSVDRALIPVEPFLSRDPNSVWAKAHEIRDAIYEQVSGYAAAAGYKVLANRSIDFTFPAWVVMVAWLPTSAGFTERVRLEITIEPKPHSRYPFEFKLKCLTGGIERSYGAYHQMDASMVRAWTNHTLAKAERPPHGENMMRKTWWQFWRPRNEIESGRGARFTPQTIAVLLGAFGAYVTLGSLQTRSGYYRSGPQPTILLGIAMVAIAIGVWFWLRRRRPIYVNSGRPQGEPRVLALADTWQVMLDAAGQSFETLRQRLQQRLTTARSLQTRFRLERISYITSDGKQERDQMVLTSGRAIVFIHVYQYEKDLYVGWDAHMNFGEWSERALAHLFDWRSFRSIVVNTVMPARGRATEYDLIDLNSLIEFAHFHMIQVVRQTMAENKLDQEIDFKIVRGERQSLLGTGRERQRRFQRAAPSTTEATSDNPGTSG